MKFDNDYWHSLDRQYIEKLDVSAGKGSMGQGAPTPEMYGKEEREAIRHLARINEVDTSTHVAPNVQGFAGLGERGFSEETREKNLMEVKRTIDFAADVSRGGPVVLHTSEFPRAVSKFKEEGFEAYPKEKEKQIHYLVNEKTGEIKKGVREDEEIWIPKEKGILKDEYGKDKYVTLFGEKIPVHEYETDEQENIVIEKRKFSDWKTEFKDSHGKIDEEKAALAFYKEQLKAEQLQVLGQADEYETHYKAGLEARERILKELTFY